MTLAAVRPGPLRAHLADADAVHYPLTIRIPPVSAPSAVTLHDVQHLDLPQLFSRGERAFRSLAYHRSARSARIVIVPSAFVRDRAVELLGLDAPRSGSSTTGSTTTGSRRATSRASRSCSIRRGPGRTRTTRCCTRRSRCCGASGRSCGSCSRAAATRAPSPTASRRSGTCRWTSSCRCTSAPRRSSSRRSTRASACRRSRRWPAAARSPARSPRRCRRSAATQPGTSRPDDPEEIAAAVEDVLADPATWAARGLEHAAGFTWERSAAAHEDVYRELLA